MKNFGVSLPAGLLACSILAALPAIAQTTTNISLVNIGGPSTLVTAGRTLALSGTGTVNPFGSAAVTFNGSRNQSTGAGSGTIQGTFTFFFNRVDSFNMTVAPQPADKLANVTQPATITGGTGIFSGASGSVTYNFKYTKVTAASGTFTLVAAGDLKIGQTTTPITVVNFSGPASAIDSVSGTLTSVAGSVAPLGNVSVNFTGVKSLSSPGRIQGVLTFVLNANDSFNASFSFQFNLFSTSVSLPCTITGGTGAFRGSTGSLAANLSLNPNGTFSLTGTGTIIQPPQGAPAITSVKTAFGSASIAQNTWLEIKGSNLAPPNTPSGGVYWSNAPEFAQGRMPTQIGGISVTVNGKSAYVWWYCSAVTTSACDSDQINVLSPLDNTVGEVQVVVTRQAVSSAPMSVSMLPIAPSFLVFDTIGHSVATHTNFSYLGPLTLFPGLSTPARPLESVLVYAIGMGLPTTPLVDGSSSQSGPLPVLPVCQMGGAPAVVTGAVLVSPGLYALVVTIPAGAPSGDNVVTCSYQNSYTPPGNLLTVQR